MKLIESKTLATAAASIEFTSIPQTFTDLVLVFAFRSDRGSPQFDDALNVVFNNITTGYTNRELRGSGSAASSSTPATTSVFAGFIPAGIATANTFGSGGLYIPNYTAAINKSVSTDGVLERNDTLAYQQIMAGLWSNTAAITSIKLSANVSNLIAGSTASLYGITKGSDGIVTTS
jgi:hypothetical protein